MKHSNASEAVKKFRDVASGPIRSSSKEWGAQNVGAYLEYVTTFWGRHDAAGRDAAGCAVVAEFFHSFSLMGGEIGSRNLQVASLRRLKPATTIFTPVSEGITEA